MELFSTMSHTNDTIFCQEWNLKKGTYRNIYQRDLCNNKKNFEKNRALGVLNFVTVWLEIYQKLGWKIWWQILWWSDLGKKERVFGYFENYGENEG